MERSKRQAGFTLVELLVVVIIVGVLAGVGIPLLTGQIDRARASEAEAGLGTIRSGLRAFFAENETYVGATLAGVGINTTAGSPTGGDLDGRYFDDGDYSLPSLTLTASTYCIQAIGSGAGPTEAPRAADVAGVTRSMNEAGTISTAACI